MSSKPLRPGVAHNFAGFHPGSVLAVHEGLGDEITLWAHRNLSECGLTGRSSIWSIRIPE